MLRKRTISGREGGERGVVVLLVAIVLLFVVGAMAVLAIDLVTFYTARSEAQLAADSAALAGARVLANSGVTSSAPSDVTLIANAKTLATTVAKQVATHNKVGGRNLVDNGQEVKVSFSTASNGAGFAPQVTVQVSRDDLPTFFARIWGQTQVTTKASATAEAYNPSGLNVTAGKAPPVAPTCVKPWVLPNIDPSLGPATPPNRMFDATTGAIVNPGLLGWTGGSGPIFFNTRCTNCAAFPTPSLWRYYPGSPADFPAPTNALPTCGVPLNAYQESVAGCVQTPIACHSTVDLDPANHLGRNSQTVAAVNCLTHATANEGDQVADNPAVTPGQPFQFLAGDDNPVVNARGNEVMVSDSMVTVPVYDIGAAANPPAPTNPVTIIGFVQLFLNPNGQAAQNGPTRMGTTVVNLVGCGTNATGQAVLGNGASPVAVRLVAP